MRLLLDAIGSSRATRRFFRPLLDAGGELAWFHPARFGRVWTRTWVNMRTHRKIVVIDGRIAYTGGINVTDEENDRLRADAYRDLHMRITGDAVRGLQLTFVEDWAFATKERLEGRVFFPELEPLHEAALEDGEIGPIVARGITDGPDVDMDKLKWAIHGAFACAKKRVRIATPYFLPSLAGIFERVGD